MKTPQSILILSICLATTSIGAMEENKRPNSLLRRCKSSETLGHSQEFKDLQQVRLIEATIVAHSILVNQISVAPVPPLKPKAKQPTPPAPQKPQSFLKQNKKAIIFGGVGLGILTAGGLLWRLNSNSSAVQKDWYNERVG